ncbi:MAG TPA: ATP-binding protein, partial [Clostridia bacterium]
EALLYQISIDERYLGYHLPALSLQTLIENAVLHGCRVSRETTTIRIYSKTAENILELHVQDNGKGMASDQLHRLQQMLSSDTPDTPDTVETEIPKIGVGLSNVNRRIKLRYGNMYGVDIDSQIGQGTQVTLRLPMPEKVSAAYENHG